MTKWKKGPGKGSTKRANRKSMFGGFFDWLGMPATDFNAREKEKAIKKGKWRK